ncbi:MAG: phage tail sheath subtilisin-like domain-containing protein, partial [Anaerolineae bacterium]
LDAPLNLRYTVAGCQVFLVGVTDAPQPASGVASLTIEANSEGLWGRAISISVADTNGAVGLAEAAGVETTLTGDLTASATDPTVSVADTTGFADGDLARVDDGTNSQLVKINTVDSPTQVTLATTDYPIANTFAADSRFILATAGRSGSNQLDLRSTNNFYGGAVIEVDDGETKSYHTISSIEGRSLVLSANLTRDVASGTVVRVVEFSLTADDGLTSERFDNLSLNPATGNYVETIINAQSKLIQASDEGSTRPAPFNLPRTTDGAATNLTGGKNGDTLTADDYRGVDQGPGNRTGIKGLADIDEVSIIAAPGISDSAVQNELILQCEELKDRFAVLDPPSGSAIDDVILQRNEYDTLYAALYYPWLRIRDPLYPNDVQGRLIPPSGHVIGIYARVDTERGVHKAPANEVVRGITDLEIKINDREQDILNPLNINVIRDFRGNGRGVRVWGSRVITSDNAWKYIPVRRLFIFLEESLDEGLQWVVFEPNGTDLWARVRRTITSFLRTTWLAGQLAGVTEEEAFFVRCDRSTMTEDDIANGRLICLVGVAPLRPAEFVIIRIGQKTLEATS